MSLDLINYIIIIFRFQRLAWRDCQGVLYPQCSLLTLMLDHDEEFIHDATLEFSFDLSGDLDLTSTPAKSTSIEDDLRSASEASSPVSFTAPPFSPLPTLGSPLSELQTNDQSSTVASDGDSNLQVATAPEENNIQFSEKER